MIEEDWYKKTYTMSIKDCIDNIKVRKIGQSDWVHIRIDIENGSDNYYELTIRSQQHVEGLHFLLGQLLGKN